MDQKDLNLIIEALDHAVQIIGVVAAGKRGAQYEDFEDPEIQDMYYKVMGMLLTVYNKRDGKECATCVYYDTDEDDQPCCTCHRCSNWEKQENNTADCG